MAGIADNNMYQHFVRDRNRFSSMRDMVGLSHKPTELAFKLMAEDEARSARVKAVRKKVVEFKQKANGYFYSLKKDDRQWR